MLFDLDLIRTVYGTFANRVDAARKAAGTPLTLTEKILYAHLFDADGTKLPIGHAYVRGTDYVNFRPDRVAMQDATAQMALLQFMNAGRDRSAVPASVHCDHLILADRGASDDLRAANESNREVYDFLRSVANRYGLGFWRPGAGIIHQVVLENYAFPGGMMIGTDSHTPNAGGLGMIAIGVGGADAVDVMAGMPWELKMPKIIGVRLSGKLSGWASPKDVILKLAGLLTVKGGTNAVIEYFGEGTASLSATGKATICNMGAEVGATTSLFPYDEAMARYLRATGREEVASLADRIASDLIPDAETAADAAKYYDRVIDIDLSALEPHINGPFTPDAAHTISDFGAVVREKGYPRQMEVGLIGSCTNSSYQDLSRAASVARQAKAKGLKAKAKLIINPGSEQVRQTAERDGLLDDLLAIGGTVMTNACGPCIGMGQSPNSAGVSLRTFNRNFLGRSGTKDAQVYLVSPETAVAAALTGFITDPQTLGEMPAVTLPDSFRIDDRAVLPPVSAAEADTVEVLRGPNIRPFPRSKPFADSLAAELVLKVGDNITTDHIMPAGAKILPYRSNIPKLSEFCFTVCDPDFPARAKAAGDGIIVGGSNYGQGSSREHAALVPMYLGIRCVVAKSFARIHAANLINAGILPLTFADPADYDALAQGAHLRIDNIRAGMAAGALTLTDRATGKAYPVVCSLTERQQAILLAGGLLNYTKEHAL